MSLNKGDFNKSFEVINAIAEDDSTELKRLMIGADVWVVDPDALNNLGYDCKRWLVDPMGGCASILKKVGCINVYLPLHEKKWEEVVFGRLFLNLRDSPDVIRRHSINACWLLGVNYILADTPDLNMPGFEVMGVDAKLSFHPGAYLYGNTRPYARFFLTRNIRRYRYYDEGRFMMLLDDETPKDEYGVVIPDSQNPPQFEERMESVKGEVRMVRDGFNSYEVEVACDKDCYLIVRDNIYPGWEVLVDGESSTLYQADYINRAVYITEGVHRVEFRFRLVSFRNGMIISVISVCILLLVGVGVRWKWRI
jgi:hypothetical protein